MRLFRAGRAAGACPDGGGYRDVTDLDVIAVRFPHVPHVPSPRAARPLDVFLGTDPALAAAEDRVEVVIGEVKEGAARLNPALRRAETVAFALRRAGCCPEDAVEEEARLVARTGEREFAMPELVRCRVRLIAFGGHGIAAEPGVRTVSLGHCAAFIAARLREARDVLAGAQLKNPVLGLFALLDKIGQITPVRE